VGTLDLEQALKEGEKHFEPGLLAAAHRGILYVDEVNLLDDHVVDVLLDSAAMGVNTVEREGISYTHPARFTLVGTMNPEEGELRPQLLDRFGLCVTVHGALDPQERVEVIERRVAFDDNPELFVERWAEESRMLADEIVRAMALYPSVSVPRELLFEIAAYCLDVGVDGRPGGHHHVEDRQDTGSLPRPNRGDLRGHRGGGTIRAPPSGPSTAAPGHCPRCFESQRARNGTPEDWGDALGEG